MAFILAAQCAALNIIYFPFLHLSNTTVTLNFESRHYFHRKKIHQLETRTTSDLCLTVHENFWERGSKECVIEKDVSGRTSGKIDFQTCIIILGHIFMGGPRTLKLTLK